MQYIERYNLQPTKAGAYREWLLKHEELLAKEGPEGWKYLGTWFTVRGFGQHECETRWELADYSALGAGFGSQAYQDAWAEIMDWFDPAQYRAMLMKNAADVAIQKGA
jgi:hypothetical protein